MKTITIQPAQFTDNVWVGKSGDIVEGKKLPYPFHIDAESGDVQRQDFWQGDPAGCLGFQNDAEVQRLDVPWRDAAADPDSIVGKFPVMVEDSGNIYTYTLPVESVMVTES